jgi:hypothetical protein
VEEWKREIIITHDKSPKKVKGTILTALDVIRNYNITEISRMIEHQVKQLK